MDVVCGFIVLRLPQTNFDSAGRGAFTRAVPKINDAFYGGFDRMPWFDIDEAFYGGTLPQELRRFRDEARSSDFTGIDLVTHLDSARSLLSFANRGSKRNEIVTLFSGLLASINGTASLAPDAHEWLGWDAAPLGHSSLLLEGVFSSPELFGKDHSLVNRFGLLRSEADVKHYISRYRAIADRSLVEPIIEDPYEVDSIRIGRLREVTQVLDPVNTVTGPRR